MLQRQTSPVYSPPHTPHLAKQPPTATEISSVHRKQLFKTHITSYHNTHTHAKYSLPSTTHTHTTHIIYISTYGKCKRERGNTVMAQNLLHFPAVSDSKPTCVRQHSEVCLHNNEPGRRCPRSHRDTLR